MYDEKITRRLFFSMVPVQILMVLSGGFNVIIDGFFASNLIGPGAMAVTGLYAPLAKILDTLNALMFGGSQILCGKYLGENMLKRAKCIFSLDVMIMAIIGTIGSILFVFVPDIPASICVHRDNTLHADLIVYLTGVGTGVVPYLLATQFTSFMQLEKKEHLGYISIGVMFVSNCVLDYVLIKVLDMGIFGLGLATAISNWLAFFVLVFHYFTKNAVFKFDYKGLTKRDLGDIFKLGLPMAGSQFLLAVRGLILNAVIGKFAGNDGLAAYAAVGTFGYIYWAVPAGMTAAMVTLASVFTGEQDRSAIRLLMKIYFRKAVPIVCAASAVLCALSYPMTFMYFRDTSSAVFTMTLIGFALFPLSTPFSAILVGIRDLWRCMEYKSAVIIIVVSDGFVIVLALSYLFGSLLGMTGIWIAQVAGCVGVVLVILILAWIKTGRFRQRWMTFVVSLKASVFLMTGV
jgi:Na+-driven multidrug efflux pump